MTLTAARRRGAAFGLAALVAVALGYAWLRPLSVLEGAGELLLRAQGVSSRELQAGPYRVRYLQAGDGQVVVLIHGLGSSAIADWGRLMPALARRYRVYALDLPGFGRSERSREATYSIPMQVETVRRFMDAVGAARARVVGVSMGGWIAARLAGESPERVERLALVAAAGMRPEQSAPIPAEVLLPHDERDARRLIAAVRHKPPPAPSFVVRDLLARKRQDEWIVRRALESMRPGRDWLNGTLARARMPVLVLWGRQDALIPVAYARPLQAEFHDAKLELLDGCGHVAMADCPEAVARSLFAFLSAPDGSASP